MIRTVAGGGLPNLSTATPGGGRGGAGVAVDRIGNVFFVGSINTAVWRLDAFTSLIPRVAGNSMRGFGGDGGPAINAQIGPAGIALDPAGNLYIADAANNRVRKVSNGIITTVASNGTLGSSGDNGPAVGAQLNAPLGVAVDSAGNIDIANVSNSQVRKVSNGTISTVAGNGTPFSGGDNGPAISASLNPSSVAIVLTPALDGACRDAEPGSDFLVGTIDGAQLFQFDQIDFDGLNGPLRDVLHLT